MFQSEKEKINKSEFTFIYIIDIKSIAKKERIINFNFTFLVFTFHRKKTSQKADSTCI